MSEADQVKLDEKYRAAQDPNRDLSDPKLILEFAQTCGDRTNLRNLYLATFADIRASSPDAWTPWKGQGGSLARQSDKIDPGNQRRKRQRKYHGTNVCAAVGRTVRYARAGH